MSDGPRTLERVAIPLGEDVLMKLEKHGARAVLTHETGKGHKVLEPEDHIPGSDVAARDAIRYWARLPERVDHEKQLARLYITGLSEET